MKRFLLIILTLILILPLSEGYADCSIDGKLSPKLAKYKTDLRAELTKMTQNTTSSCGPTSGGAISSATKSIELTDRAMLQIPISGDILLDFQYNTVMAFRGESRRAVQENGKIFQRIQDELIAPTIRTLSNTCNLSDTKKSRLVELIRINYLLETVYKSTALGTPRGKDGLPSQYEEIYNEILQVYNPTATASCKNEFDYEGTISKDLESFSNGTFGIENAYDNWKEAIALFSGNSIKGIYKDIARKLLVRELSRQGMSKNARDIIVGNFDCAKSQLSGDTTIDDQTKAVADCRTFQIAGLADLKKAATKAENMSPNTEVYIAQTQKNQSLIGNMTQVGDMYAKYSGEVGIQSTINDNMLSSLINLHIDILSINKILDIRIPIMQKNCMKALPGIVGGCRKDG